MQKVDLTGQKFSMLTVMKETESLNGKKRYICRCDCGNIIEKSYANLKGLNGRQSCGCMKKEWLKESQTKHGMKYTKLYRTWQGIRSRSINSNTFKDIENHKTYTEKGITVCDEWENSFESFMKWSIDNGYSEEKAKKEKLSIDRIDNNGNYEPNNCQWIYIGENSRKERIGKSNTKCRKLTDKNVEDIENILKNTNLSQVEIAEKYNIERTTISRIKRKVLNYVK